MPRPLLVQRYGIYLQKKLNLTDENAEMAAFGFEVILTYILPLVAIILAGWLLNCLSLVLTASGVAAWLKLFAGGAHSSSMIRCSLMGAVVGGVIGRLAAVAGPVLSTGQILIFILITLAVSLGACWRLAPVKSKNRQSIDPVRRKEMRDRALKATIMTGLIALALTLFSGKHGAPYALATGQALLWQSFIMTPAGKNAIDFMDNFFTTMSV